MNQNTDLPRNNKSYSLMTLILFWCGLVIMTSMYITIPLSDVFAQAFQISVSQVAWIGSAFSLCYALGCLLYGPFSDRYGRKIFLVASIIGLTVITITIGFVNSFFWLIVLRGLQGLIAAAFAPISLVYAGEMFPPHKRLTAVGFISSGLLMAGIVGQVFSGIVNERLGWHGIFFVQGIVYGITAIIVITLLPKDDLHRPKEHILLKFKQMTGLLKQPQLLLAFSVTFVLLLSLVGMYTVLGSYLSSPKFGLSPQQILYIRAAGIAGMLLSPFAGRIAQKLGTAAVLRGGLALAAAGLFALGFSASLPVIILMSIVFVSGIALITPVIISIVSQLGGQSRGSAISFNAFILFLGASTGPMIALKLLKTGNYLLSFEILGSILVLGLLVSLFLRISSRAAVKSEKMSAAPAE
ncbi:MFS transporter [Paenibacillus sp. FSL R7-0273]|uniref:MFS transporter n=1 Tax=Paenibacillus sp. FSL R7-0273 TaxID=1536772 RepID=UPI0004F653DB|nr:MFS transporter [Paenibacillus sp. FSL R7-0273]AIQ47338.1 MFS transporter [Paenibacillus sp. FSL R7-0273]OMF96108.1 MFS transporter [Paenibacillus sp. FSL R7-0273]